MDTTALTPAKVVELLDRYIIGQARPTTPCTPLGAALRPAQAEAKRAVAVALRNRWRRHKVGSPLREEIVPKNSASEAVQQGPRLRR